MQRMQPSPLLEFEFVFVATDYELRDGRRFMAQEIRVQDVEGKC
jgi:hypothetical protein